ncbi:MAG: DinB family protein [Candidatus Thorarchaeota archaeon]
MKDIVTQILKQGLRGHNTHMSPRRVFLGLDVDSARLVPGEGAHSCLDQLFHIVFWQDLVLEVARGKKVDWAETHGKDWPTETHLLDNSLWDSLLERFELGLKQADDILDNDDLTKPMPAWSDAPVAKAMLVLAQHNSYHLGQIVLARQVLKKWPPPEEPTD